MLTYTAFYEKLYFPKPQIVRVALFYIVTNFLNF